MGVAASIPAKHTCGGYGSATRASPRPYQNISQGKARQRKAGRGEVRAADHAFIKARRSSSKSPDARPEFR